VLAVLVFFVLAGLFVCVLAGLFVFLFLLLAARDAFGVIAVSMDAKIIIFIYLLFFISILSLK